MDTGKGVTEAGTRAHSVNLKTIKITVTKIPTKTKKSTQKTASPLLTVFFGPFMTWFEEIGGISAPSVVAPTVIIRYSSQLLKRFCI